VIEKLFRTRFGQLQIALPIILTFALIVAFTCFSPASAANRFNSGDDVEVHYLGSWRPAKVVSTNARGEVLLEYEFAGRSHRKAFKQNEVRQKYEAGALTRLRTWTDSTGNFKVEAVLLGSDGEAITLRKPDLSEIKVPIAKLSTGDQSYVERIMKSAGAAGKFFKLPPLEKFTDNPVPQKSVSEQRAALTPDPLPAYVTLKQGGTAFAKADFHESITAVIAIGGPDGWLLAATKNQGDKPSRVIWISADKNKAEGQQLLPAGEIVLDYHAPSHRLLTYAEFKDHEKYGNATVLTLWKVIPSDEDAKAIVRWDATVDWTKKPGEPWARLINGDIVLHRAKKYEFVGWDTAQKQVRYRIVQESFFAPDPALSPGGRHLLIPNDKKVHIYDAATGNLLSVLPSVDGSAAVAVTNDGRRVAVLGRSTLRVWNLTDAASEPQVYQAETIGTPFDSNLSWVGTDRLMASRRSTGQLLFSLKHKCTLWSYQTDFTSRIHQWRGERLREVVADHLVYAATVREGSKQGFAVGSVQLPGPQVDEAAASLDPESLLIMKPGSGVQIQVRAGQNTPRVRAALEKEVAKNGWRIDPSASATLIAEMKRGETQDVTYRFFDGRGEESASVTPYISSLKLNVGEVVAWQSGTSSGAPFSVRLKEGESVQDEVDRWQRPNPAFFDSVDIPDKIMDPAHRNGLGTTKVTNRGLVPGDVTPPTAKEDEFR